MRADELREVEAVEVAATIARILDEGWSVERRGRAERLAHGRAGRHHDPACPPARRCRSSRRALRSRGIAYRAESSSLVYVTQAVRDLLMTLRAVDDPTDHLRIVVGPAHAVVRLRRRRPVPLQASSGAGTGATRATSPTPCPPTTPCGWASSTSRSLHGERQWTAPSELLERIARDRRAFEIGFAEGRPRDVWRRLRFVIDQARRVVASRPAGACASTSSGWSGSRTRAPGSPRRCSRRPTTTRCGS